MQIESINDDLKNAIWNSYLNNLIGQISMPARFGNNSVIEEYISLMWSDFFKLRIDERFVDPNQNLNVIKTRFFKLEWYEVYDFIEFHFTQYFLLKIQYPYIYFLEDLNRVLEREFAGYRLIEGKIVPISNETEVAEINEALNLKKNIFGSKSNTVQFHLSEALSKLSDKKNPDYRNSIKESISAVESLCRQLTDTTTLGDALKSLEKKGIVFNPQLKQAFEKLYAYTNSKESGIRHALIETPNLPTFHDAKFMLVSCSAFINYLNSLPK
jgi:hypothetical protein